MPPAEWGRDPILAAHAERMLQMDIAAQRELKERMERLSVAAYAGWASSSGFRVATELRRFWYEYFERFGRFRRFVPPASFRTSKSHLASGEGIRRLRVGGTVASLRFWRDDHGRSHARVLDKDGPLHIVRQPPPESGRLIGRRIRALAGSHASSPRPLVDRTMPRK